MQDVLYEESAVNQRSKTETRKYRIINVCSWIVFIIALLGLMIFLTMFLPYLFVSENTAPPEGVSVEEWQSQILGAKSAAVFVILQVAFFAVLGFSLYSLKKRVNVSYDYTFVSGELRVAKVFNINRRKFLYRFQPDDIQQLGDVDGANFDRLSGAPETKRILLTPNEEPAEGKFFMYLLSSDSTGKKLYIFECREELLVNILRFVKRGTLDPDYVSQEKKKAQAK